MYTCVCLKRFRFSQIVKHSDGIVIKDNFILQFRNKHIHQRQHVVVCEAILKVNYIIMKLYKLQNQRWFLRQIQATKQYRESHTHSIIIIISSFATGVGNVPLLSLNNARRPLHCNLCYSTLQHLSTFLLQNL